MELSDILALLRKRWITVAVVGMLGITVGLALSLLTTPRYSATSQVFVSVRGSDSTTDLLQGSNFTVRQVKSYTELISSPRVLQPVIDDLGLSMNASALAEQVHADSPTDTVLINVKVSDASPEKAAAISNAVAGSLATVVSELETPPGGGNSPVQLSTVRQASVPISPTSPNLKLDIVVGLLAGVGVGVALAILRDLLDTRVRSRSDVENIASDFPLLGVIGLEPGIANRPLVIQDSPHSLRAEALRRLRTNLQFLSTGSHDHTFVITSSLPSEGKSTTSINLAITQAEAGARVVLVDADLRRPSVASYLGIEGSVGLTTVLIGRAGIDDVVQPWGNGNLDVITAGQIPPNPSELLGSQAMSDFLADLRRRYDVVIVDTAPLLPVTDGAILARLAGGAIIVVGADTVHRQQLEAALTTLGTVGAPVLGLVLNRARARATGSEYGYYEYTSSGGTTVPAR
ncbi:polysaccharide biosynthesis tyrosine autokinase [Xylanimonas allomyrinae]|uniref:non-specific protein-tyrosine kinase n=1 Tax=Xylanimonas allomyrinae TaxID=2509459 RepID=A0A4V0YE87_9MICO|nr:polysaccharide biosynthesis tyrosine autokinase [Xylanimonas allomyrinae]QAY63351.1 polysaccharide biosynthesis tyrosine autokinase [Xylanimonas allomyrinae]